VIRFLVDEDLNYDCQASASHVPLLCRERAEINGTRRHPVDLNGIVIRPYFPIKTGQGRVSLWELGNQIGEFDSRQLHAFFSRDLGSQAPVSTMSPKIGAVPSPAVAGSAGSVGRPSSRRMAVSRAAGDRCM
jgi:hypothetical protein